MNIPQDLRYTKDHEWVRLDGDTATIGVTDFAQGELGDIVFVELPQVGAGLTRGTSFGSVESVKAVEDLMAPVSGTVEARNEAVLASPEELQNDPYGEGWLLLVRLGAPEELEELMDAGTYGAKLQAS